MSDASEPADILPRHLVQGYEAFLAGDFRRERSTFCELAARGQHPHSLVIGCCDSRVMPEEIFAAAPGEIFDLRNIANLVPPYAPDQAHISVWAAVDYALETLKVRHIVVLGHARCGGVRAYLDGAAESGSGAAPALAGWIGLIAPAARRLAVRPGDCAAAEQLAHLSVMQSLDNLRGHPNISRREREGELRLHGAYFDIESARLLALHEGQGAFLPVAPEIYAMALRATDR